MMWRVKDWENIFEKAQSKKCSRMAWVAVPNRHDTDGYTRLIEHEHGLLHYGAWVLLVQVASKCKPRGTLVTSNGEAHTTESLARITRVSVHVFKEAIPRFLSPEIGWLEDVTPALPPRSQQTGSTLGTTRQDKTRQDKTEQDNKDLSASADDTVVERQLREWLGWWNRLHAEGLVSSRVNEERPSEAVLRGWKRVQRSSEVRELLAQCDDLENRIRESVFLQEGWFRLEKLFGAKNRDGELIVRKVLDGGYRNRMSGGQNKVGPGQKFDPAQGPLPVKGGF